MGFVRKIFRKVGDFLGIADSKPPPPPIINIPPPPPIPELPEVPTRESPEVAEAQSRLRRRKLGSQGRQGTILGGSTGGDQSVRRKTLLGE